MGGWVYIAEGFGRGSSVGLIVWTTFQAFKFACTFIAGRQDARQARLEVREQRVDESLAKRLDHLERAEAVNQRRIGTLEECVAILATEVRQTDPANPKLGQVARMLANVHPFVPPDPNLDELLQHAANAVEKGKRA